METEKKLSSNYDSIEKCFEAHEKLRTRMLTSRFHGVDNERVTIKIILKIFRED